MFDSRQLSTSGVRVNKLWGIWCVSALPMFTGVVAMKGTLIVYRFWPFAGSGSTAVSAVS